MIETASNEYHLFSEHYIYENKLPALPPPSPSQSSILTITTQSSQRSESIEIEDSQESEILAQIERQNVLLEKDPKSILIQSNKLKAHVLTMERLVKDTRRGRMWQAMSKSTSLPLEAVYEQLCQMKSPHERIIQRDLSRTFPKIEMFRKENGVGQSAMKRVLEAYSLYDTDVGYCQGLGFLVGPLLLTMSETQSFCVFVRLMEAYEMRSMFTLNMEGLQLRLFQFNHLLKEVLPDLSEHLDRHGIHAAMYASQWFLTLFAYVFPMELIYRIYDVVFADGAVETIVRVAIAMLKRSEHEIQAKVEFEDILDFLTSRKLCEPYLNNFDNVIHDALLLSDVITTAKIERLASKYNGRLGFWRLKRKPKRRSPLEELKRVHQKTLDALAEMRCDKQELECERNALKLTIEELERCQKGSLSDLNVAERGQKTVSMFELTRQNTELEQQCTSLRQELEDTKQKSDQVIAKNEQLQEELKELKRKVGSWEYSNKSD